MVDPRSVDISYVSHQREFMDCANGYQTRRECSLGSQCDWHTLVGLKVQVAGKDRETLCTQLSHFVTCEPLARENLGRRDSGSVNPPTGEITPCNLLRRAPGRVLWVRIKPTGGDSSSFLHLIRVLQVAAQGSRLG